MFFLFIYLFFLFFRSVQYSLITRREGEEKLSSRPKSTWQKRKQKKLIFSQILGWGLYRGFFITFSYVFVDLCVCLFVFVCLCVYVYIHICADQYVSECRFVYLCAHAHVCYYYTYKRFGEKEFKIQNLNFQIFSVSSVLIINETRYISFVDKFIFCLLRSTVEKNLLSVT